MVKRYLPFIFLFILTLTLTQASLIETAITTNGTYNVGDNFDDNILDSKWIKHNAFAVNTIIQDDPNINEDIQEQNQKIELVVNGTGATGKGWFSLGRWVNRTSLLAIDLDLYYNLDPTGYFMVSGFDSFDGSMSWRMYVYDGWTSSDAGYMFIAYDTNQDLIHEYDTGFGALPDQEGILHFNGAFNGNDSMEMTVSGEYNHAESISGDIHYWDYILVTFGINHDLNNPSFYLKADDYVELYSFEGDVDTYTETITYTETETTTNTETDTITDTVEENITSTIIETLYEIETTIFTSAKADLSFNGLTLISIFAISTIAIIFRRNK